MRARAYLPQALMAIAVLAVVVGWFLPFSVESALESDGGFRVVETNPGVLFLAEADPVPGLFERSAAVTAAISTVVAFIALPRYERFAMPPLALAVVALYTVGGRVRDHGREMGFGSGAAPADDRQILQLGTGFWIAFVATAALLGLMVAHRAGWLGAREERRSVSADAA